MDKITHCELLYDRLLIILESGSRFTLSRDDAIRLGFAIAHNAFSLDSVDLSDMLQEGFNWNGPRTVGNGRFPARGCKTCGPADWKPSKE